MSDFDILLNANPISGYEDNLDITLNVTNTDGNSEVDFLITLDVNYDLYDYQYCNNFDILLDIVPEGLFNSTSIEVDSNGDIIIDPETNEPLIEPPTANEYMSCFGTRAYFQLPDCSDAIEISPEDIINVNVKTGINQPIYWSLDIVNKDRKYSDPNGTYANLFTENLYVPERYSRRFVAIVLMSFCGEETRTLIFPRLVIKEISGTEIISISGIDEISEYLSRNVTMEAYCCQEALSKVIPSGQETLDPDLVISNEYVAVALTNAFTAGGIANNDTQLLLNYNYDLPFTFNSSLYIFTVAKPEPKPPIYGELPGETPVYQLQDISLYSTILVYGGSSKYELVSVDGISMARVPTLDINGQYIRDSYGNVIYQYYTVDPRLPVIAISPLSMQWVIKNMCEKIIDNQDGYIKKEYFKVNQYYQDFKIYSDINIQNTTIGSVLDTCLGAIPAEYTINGPENVINSYSEYNGNTFPVSSWNPADYNGTTFYIYITKYTFTNASSGTTVTTETLTHSGISNNSSGEEVNWVYYICQQITTVNTNIIENDNALSANIINSWKLSLNIHDVILDSEKPSRPNWYIPEILLRTPEHNISRTGVTKFNTINVISPMELGTAQVYPSVYEQPPTSNQYVRPIFSNNTGNFIGFSAQFPITTKSDSFYYTSSTLSVTYPATYYSGSIIVNFGNNNFYTISPSGSSPSICNIYDFNRTSYYVLTILWNNSLYQ